ncbi:hypothetical protein ALT1000_80014 [Alteromonas macleodii]
MNISGSAIYLCLIIFDKPTLLSVGVKVKLVSKLNNQLVE